MLNLIGNLMILGMLNLSITSPLISWPDMFLGKQTAIVISSVECACITKGNGGVGSSVATVTLLPSDHINFTSNREQLTADFELSIIASNKAKGWLIRQFSKLTCGFAFFGQDKTIKAIVPIIKMAVPIAIAMVNISDNNSIDMPFAPLRISYKTAYHIVTCLLLMLCGLIWILFIILRLRR